MQPSTCGTLLFALLVAGCNYASDIPSGDGSIPTVAEGGAVRIEGLEKFHQTASTVTVFCRNAQFETDRRAVAAPAIQRALAPYVSASPGSLRVEVESLVVRVRCHDDGFGGMKSYCTSDASLGLVASGKDRRGEDVRQLSRKEVSERIEGILVCSSAMPAVTRSVDKALDASLGELQRGLTAQTGIAAP